MSSAHAIENTPTHLIDNTEISLSEIFAVITLKRKNILWSLLVGLALGILISFLTTTTTTTTTTTYTATATIQASNEEGDPIPASLLSSPTILYPAINKYPTLNTTITPHYFPYIGNKIANHYTAKTSHHHTTNAKQPLAHPMLGLTQYAWGGEHITLSSFDVPDTVINQLSDTNSKESANFTLTTKKNNQFTLSHNNNIILTGSVGKKAISTNTRYPDISILISKLQAHPKTTFTLTKSTTAITAQQLTNGENSDLHITPEGDIITLTYKNTSKQLATDVVNAIISQLKLNTTNNTQSIQKNIGQLTQKNIPFNSTQLDQAIKKISGYLTTSSSKALNKTTLSLINDSIANQVSLSVVDYQQQALINQSASQNLLDDISEKVRELNNQKAIIANKIKELSLEERIMINNTLSLLQSEITYLTDINQVAQQELALKKQGYMVNTLSPTTATIDPTSTHKSSHSLLALLGLFVSGLITTAYFIFQLLIRKTLNPNIIAAQTKLTQFCTLPYLSTTTLRHQSTLPSHPFYEALRALRTSIKHQLKTADNAIISTLNISDTTNSAFISANLAMIFAEHSDRVLFIDANLRQSNSVHYFNTSHKKGLNEYLDNTANLESITHTINEYLDFIPGSLSTQHPIQLLETTQLDLLLDTVKEQYDIIIINNAPILSFTDSTYLAKKSATNLLLAGLDNHLTENEFMDAVTRYRLAGASLSGWVGYYTTEEGEYMANVKDQPTNYNARTA